MNHRIALLTGAICLASLALSQAPSIEWERTLGGSDLDRAYAVRPTSDGGFIIAGISESEDGDVVGGHGQMDGWFVKTDHEGELQWQLTFGDWLVDWFEDVVEIPTGGFVFVGHTGIDAYNLRVISVDESGEIVWAQSLGGTFDDKGHAIDRTTDGGFIVAGSTHSNDLQVSGNHGADDVWVVKLGQNGTIQWQRCLGGTSSEVAYDICATPDGGSVLVGSTYSNDGDVTGIHGEMDMWAVKIDADGAIQWQHCLGGQSSDFAYAVRPALDGGYIFVGGSRSSDGDLTVNQGDSDYWIVKLDQEGDLVWQRSMGGSQYDEAVAVVVEPGGGYTVTGFSSSSDGDVVIEPGANYGGAWLIRLNGNGEVEWQKAYGGASLDQARSLYPTPDNGYIMGGGKDMGYDEDLWIVKLVGGATAVSEVQTTPASVRYDADERLIRIDLSPDQIVAWATVCSAAGPVVHAFAVVGQTGLVSTDGLAPGIYVVTVAGTFGRTSFPVVIP